MSEIMLPSSNDVEKVDGIRIKLVGIGGAGCNTISRLASQGLNGVITIAANTDVQHLEMIRAHHKIVLGKNTTRFRGSGGDPEKGRMATEECEEEFRNLLSDADIVFVMAGLGGGTGTGGAPVVASVAKELGAIVISVATLPFKFEGNVRKRIAIQGLQKLKEVCNTVVLIDNNKLLDFYPQYELRTAFSLVDDVINNMLLSITESIVKPSLINIDYADFKTLVERGSLASLGIGRSSSPNRAEEATFNALQSPLLDVTYDKLSGAIVHVTGGEDMKLSEAARPAEIISELMGMDTLVIWGARIDNYYASTMQVSLILTGLSDKFSSSAEIEAVSLPKTNEELKIPQPVVPAQPTVDNELEYELERIVAELGIRRLSIENAHAH
ncbi:MAG: cell division protein FtsZ [Thaumarchaeota archaeon]|nr:cell division protein FtsZ [Candidatus Terraquivivens yellowstonensis]MCL7387490.1 cell division protein FtsZ [Candidatus Terraquivivens yellowstonensis]MCL7392148.1 cell division protein FtsZ [Candidatus Terraquivivens yellowstonensis]MCL7397950.1 cell division protein FtsZ [Candidatus Terraquivivens yellowstonensis]MCL7399338.1 cell division protein FtsZ [Candidatus Terraquivivens yellowstonensis]